jgi:carboxypeptidase C (cathepsin A)
MKKSPSSIAQSSTSKGGKTTLKIQLSTDQGTLGSECQVESDWITLYTKQKPEARVFYTWYKLVKTDEGKVKGDRPLTFVFNGGPGASSVYLHLGALGPKTIALSDAGYPLPPPNKLEDNPETWLSFTDLVFVDPVGTGFSYAGSVVGRELGGTTGPDNSELNKDQKELSTSLGFDGPSSNQSSSTEEDGKPYYTIKEDLASLGQFMSKFLTKIGQWESAIYLAGESYGGFRAAKMSRIVQEDFGIPLAGVIMISPALEFTLLTGSDYDAPYYLDVFPSMAAAAAFHGKARNKKPSESIPEFSNRAAEFALNQLLPVLAGNSLVYQLKPQTEKTMSDKQKLTRILRQAADFTGMDPNYLIQTGGRITIQRFIKHLLIEQNLLAGIYDASFKQKNPFPDRPVSQGPEPTLNVLERVFTPGINQLLRGIIGVDTPREYALLNGDVFQNWKIDTQAHVLDLQVGATDDLRYGIALNQHTKFFLCHGIYDLRTPWFSSERITCLMGLDGDDKQRFTLRYYDGGHMFYSWKHSKQAFYLDMKQFYSG